MKILVCPDKFKGSLNAHQVSAAIKKGILSFDSSFQVVTCPLADGGEGSLDILRTHLELNSTNVKVLDPINREINAEYLSDGYHAFIELSLASGLNLLNSDEYDSLFTTTFGTGQLIEDALSKGMKKIYLFIGGSATTDCGTGIAEALGYRFLDFNGNQLKASGGTLQEINRIEQQFRSKRLSSTSFITVCDVKNPLYGPNGAAYVYAPQKGASTKEVSLLDKGLRHIADVIERDLNIDIHSTLGAGAAGGVGAGSIVFLNSKIESGIESMMEITDFKESCKAADLLITGEGKLDNQSLDGKVIYGVKEYADKKNINWGCICGVNDLNGNDEKELSAKFISDTYSMVDSIEESILNAKSLIEKAAYDALNELLSRK